MSGQSSLFASLQSLRGVAAVAVLLFHLRSVEAKYIPGVSILHDVAVHADVGVDLFFVLSGFVMAKVGRGRFTGFPSAFAFLMRRAWRVLPLYWLFTTLAVILMIAIPSVVNSSYSDQSIVRSYFLMPHTQLPVLAVGWTLIHEAYFYLAFSLGIAVLAERSLTICLVGWAGIIAAAHLGGGVEPHPLPQVLYSPLTFEFIAGVIAGLHWRRLPARMGPSLVMFGAALFLSAALFVSFPSDQLSGTWLRVACFGGASLLLVLGLVLLESRSRVRIPALLVALGNSSYSLYLSHVFVISAIGRLWGMLVPEVGWGGNLLFLLSAAAFSCVIGHLIHKWVELPLLKLPDRMEWLRRRLEEGVVRLGG